VKPGVAAWLVLAVLAAAPAGARELWSRGDASLEFSGSLRELLVGSHGTSASDFEKAALGDPVGCTLVATFPDCAAWDTVGETPIVTSLTRLRLRFDARATKHLSAVVVYDNEMRAGSLDTFEARLGDSLATGRFDELGQDIVSRQDFEWRHGLYRAYLLLETKRFELTFGRQRIPWGVGRLWNPIDRFNAIPPLALEADQSAGVDAVKARWLFSGFTYLEGVYAVGERSDDRSYALRLHGVLRDVDYSLMGGVFEEAPTAGFDLSTNLGDAAGRVEVVWTDPTRTVRPFDSPVADDLPAYWQIVASVDYNFDVGSGIYALVEYLYNGNALGFGRGKADGALGFFQERDEPFPTPTSELRRVVAEGTPDLFGSSRVISTSDHLTGFQLSYDLTPELRASFLTLVDWRGTSASFFPSLVYNPFGWLELTLGVQAFTGPHLSEFGSAEPLGFLLAEAFF
jgi:hypothetical protein